ncbi:MAG: PQQ-dependent sugar dehydrogenase, partial [Gemmatimonadetes bacterium]|nr:PQQ-dependent sugar dehydrogenase [Gemmatimonadota bacterium]
MQARLASRGSLRLDPLRAITAAPLPSSPERSTAPVVFLRDLRSLRTPQPSGTSSTPFSLDPTSLANLLSSEIGGAKTGLSAPLFLTHAGDSRLFVVEQGGRIRVVVNAQLLGTPYLDISSIVLHQGEQGLLGMAFHPNYAINGFF